MDKLRGRDLQTKGSFHAAFSLYTRLKCLESRAPSSYLWLRVLIPASFRSTGRPVGGLQSHVRKEVHANGWLEFLICRFSRSRLGAPQPERVFPEEKRARIFEVDPAMFDDVRLVAVLDRSEFPEAGRFTLNGHLDGVPDSYFILAYNQGALSATVYHPTLGFYEIEATGGLMGKISEFDPKRLPPVVHGMAFAAAGGETAMHSRIGKAVAEMNTAFVNPRINARMRLARAQLIDYAESGGMGTDLGRLQKPGDGFLFTSYVSADGATWTVVGNATIAMGTDVSVGLVVTSHKNRIRTARPTFPASIKLPWSTERIRSGRGTVPGTAPAFPGPHLRCFWFRSPGRAFPPGKSARRPRRYALHGDDPCRNIPPSRSDSGFVW